MPVRWFGIPLLLTASLGLAACSSGETGRPTLNTCQPGSTCGATAASGDDAGPMNWLFNFNGKGAENGEAGSGSMAVNAFLWRGTLDTLRFMPLASADPYGGVIVTDWYTPPSSPDERFKATAFILGRELRSQNLRITIFRQVLQDGRWVDAPVSPETVNDMEDRVLARSQTLRMEMH